MVSDFAGRICILWKRKYDLRKVKVNVQIHLAHQWGKKPAGAVVSTPGIDNELHDKFIFKILPLQALIYPNWIVTIKMSVYFGAPRNIITENNYKNLFYF